MVFVYSLKKIVFFQEYKILFIQTMIQTGLPWSGKPGLMCEIKNDLL